MNRPGNVSRLFVFILLLTTTSFANPPSPESIQQIISASKLEWEKFEDKSFMLRMQFDLSGRLLNDRDKTFFCELAANARNQLDQYVNQQQSMLEQIEKYEGADWEQKYGSTGLWRQLAAAVETTKLNQAQIDYLYSIICENLQPSDLVREKLFKRKLRSDLSLCEVLKVSIEQIKYFGPSEPNELNDVAQSLAKSECKDDPEMLLTLVILQHRYSPDELRNTLSHSPQTAILLGKLLLADFSSRFSQSPADVNLELVSSFDVELAAVAALQEGPKSYADLIATLAQNDRFQTPAVLYAAAILCQDARPQKTVELLIKASNSQLQQRNQLLAITPEQIAEQAFNVAYYAFTQDPNNCKPAIDAFDNYSRIASERINEQTQYLYGVLLCNCNRISEAAEVFRRLANQSQSIWRDAASLELLKIELNTTTAPTDLTRLHDFILTCTRPEEQETQIRRDAMNIYCQLLLHRDSSDAAAKILDILNAAEPTPGLRYDLFRAQSFWKLGRLEESARYMSKAVNENNNSLTPLAGQITYEILNKIEIWQQNALDFNQMLLDCNTLAEFAHKSIDNRQTALLLAESSILRGDLNLAQSLLNLLADENDIGWLRPQARLLMARGEFEQSAKLWARITELRRNDMTELNRKSYGWWQAKFYELDCLAKSPDADKQNIAHTIDVLFNSLSYIPPLWAQKLELLKKQLPNNP
ncbi:MAG: hypothetical protein ABII09_05505 [Planctomycetota bacterium]